MGTSSSTETGGWRAGAWIFSGRPDPSWTVPAETARRLLERWAELAPWPSPPVAPSRLGYRGVWAEGPGGIRFVAHAGVVARSTAETREFRADPTRDFERLLLSTAPDDVRRWAGL